MESLNNKQPLRLVPCYKEYLWGGTRLKTHFGKTDGPETLAESWELADHPDGQTVVADGPLAGKTLSELGELDRRGFWGENCRGDSFPILVKLIDADKNLSIQVHPSDQTALPELGEHGKAEMWYVVAARPQAFIYFGFSKQVTPEEYRRRVQDGSICEVLNCVNAKSGDVFFIEPGTIHAIGAGMVIAEIQQNSNTTFRVYDYNRRGPDGKPRELHYERAAQVLNYAPLVPGRCRANSVAVFPEFTMTEMYSCPYFRSYKLDVETQAKLRCDGLSFQHLLCVEGEGRILVNQIEYPIRRGESYFLPAALGEYTIEGACRVLLSRI